VSAQGTPVKVDWTIDCSAKKIKFAVSADNDGWVAVGFNDKAEMPGTDTYQGSVDSSAKVIVRNGFAEGYDILQDATVAGATGKRVGKTVTVEFERPLTVAGSNDRSITFEKLLVVNVAVGSSNTFTAQHAKRGSSKPVQFFTTGDPFNPPKGGPAPTTTAANDDDDEGTDAAPATTIRAPTPRRSTNKADIKFPNGDTVDINYVIDCVAKTIEFTVTGASKGWLAIGFNEESGKMSGTDVYQLGVVDGTFKVRNGHTEGRSLLEDGFIDGASGSVSGGTRDGHVQAQARHWHRRRPRVQAGPAVDSAGGALQLGGVHLAAQRSRHIEGARSTSSRAARARRRSAARRSCCCTVC
jgi:hypothetical protein